MTIVDTQPPRILVPDLSGSKIPKLITERRHWLTWTATGVKPNDPSRFDKVPLGANGYPVNAHDARHHRSFDEVAQAFIQAHPNALPNSSLELGYLFNPGKKTNKVAGIAIDLPVDPLPITHTPDGCPLYLLGLDWDKVVEGKEIAQDARRALAMLGKPYFEQSPSGTGLRAFALTTEPIMQFNRNGFECYSAGRFLTVTGRGKGDLLVVDQDQIKELKRKYSGTVSVPVSRSEVPSINDDLIKACAQATNPPLTSLLEAIPAAVTNGCSYGDWAKVIWAARSGYGQTPETFEALRAWSLTSPDDYDEKAFNRIWNDRTRQDGVTIGTLIHLAKLHGWPNHKPSVAHGLPAADPGETPQKPTLWDEPKPLPNAIPGVMPFDVDLLPEQIAPWAEDVSHRMQCPTDFPSIAMVVVLSSLIGARAAIRPKAHDDWLVTANLWGMVVGRPAVMKSPALSSATSPLCRLEADENERWQLAYTSWESEKKLAELAEEHAYREAKKAMGKDMAEAREHLRRFSALPVQPEPKIRRYIVNDSTVEKLGEILQQNEWGLLIYRDELHGLLTSLDKQGQEGARAFYLQAYDGNQGYTFDRIGRGTKRLNRVCFSLLGGIQPGRIQEYIRNAVTGGSGDDGLLQRFSLTVWPDVSGTFQYVDQWPNTPARQAVNAVFDRLNTLLPGENAEQPIYRFSKSAQIEFARWLTEFENEIRNPDLSPPLVSHLAKYRKLVPALALIFALVENKDENHLVDLPELVRALRWVPYLRSHAERLYAATTRHGLTSAAHLLEKLKTMDELIGEEAGIRYFTPRRVATKGWAGLSTVGEVTEAAELLVEHGWLQPMTIQPLGGGRPSVRYILNPKLV